MQRCWSAHVKKIKADGEIFDSGLEYRRYLELKMLLKLGVIKCFTSHPVFELQPSFKRGGKTIRKIEYTGDFLIVYPDGRRVVEECKGFFTPIAKLRTKVFLYKYPELDFRIVKSKDVKTLKELKR